MDLHLWHTIDTIDLTSMIGFACALALGIVLIRYLRLRKDLETLHIAAKKLLHKQPLPARFSLNTTEAEEVWKSMQPLSEQRRIYERERARAHHMLSHGSKIVHASNDSQCLADEISKLILDQCAPTAIASAVILKSQRDNQLEVASVCGIPRTRVSNALIADFESLLDGDSAWGYSKANFNTTNFDGDFTYASFSIGFSLWVPLRNATGVCGGIWLGLKGQPLSALSAGRKAYIKAISEYAAASFYAAQKAQENSEQSEQEKHFLLGVSHDLRAPGNSALYALRDLLSGELGGLSPEQHLRLSVIENSLQDQLDILGDVLDFAQHRKGTLEAQKKPLTLEGALRGTVESFALVAEHRGLELRCETFPETRVVVDPHHLKRMFANIVSNALKYTDEGEVRVSCSETRSHLELLISDTGIGVQEKDRADLFKEFSRLTNVEGRRGVGLGLALTRVLANVNNAAVFYRPNASKGSCFGLRLPKETACLATHLAEGSEEQRPSFKNALVIDDDAAVCRINRRYLEHCVENIDIAYTERQAMKLIMSKKVDLVISDYFLKYGDSRELLRKIKAHHPDVKIILMSGASDEELLGEVASLCDGNVLKKPVDKATLLESVFH